MQITLQPLPSNSISEQQSEDSYNCTILCILFHRIVGVVDVREPGGSYNSSPRWFPAATVSSLMVHILKCPESQALACGQRQDISTFLAEVRLKLALPHYLGMHYWHYQLVLSLYIHQPYHQPY